MTQENNNTNKYKQIFYYVFDRVLYIIYIKKN